MLFEDASAFMSGGSGGEDIVNDEKVFVLDF